MVLILQAGHRTCLDLCWQPVLPARFALLRTYHSNAAMALRLPFKLSTYPRTEVFGFPLKLQIILELPFHLVPQNLQFYGLPPCP